jgi:hypothetical protein
MHDAPDVEARLTQAKNFMAAKWQLVDQMPAIAVDVLRQHMYAVALDPAKLSDHRDALAGIDTTLAREQPWWRELESDTNEYAVVLARFAEETARKQTNDAIAKRDAERQAAEAKDRAQQERAHREREERAAADRERARLDRVYRARRRWRRWRWPFVFLFACTAWLGGGTLGYVYAGKQSSLGDIARLPFGWAWVAAVHSWWFRTAPERVLEFDWLAMESQSTEALALGSTLVLTSLIAMILGVMAFKGLGIGHEGRLRAAPFGLTAFVVMLSIGGMVLFLPWTVAALSGVLTVVGGLALALVIIWFVLALLFN